MKQTLAPHAANRFACSGRTAEPPPASPSMKRRVALSLAHAIAALRWPNPARSTKRMDEAYERARNP